MTIKYTWVYRAVVDDKTCMACLVRDGKDADSDRDNVICENNDNDIVCRLTHEKEGLAVEHG